MAQMARDEIAARLAARLVSSSSWAPSPPSRLSPAPKDGEGFKGGKRGSIGGDCDLNDGGDSPAPEDSTGPRIKLASVLGSMLGGVGGEGSVAAAAIMLELAEGGGKAHGQGEACGGLGGGERRPYLCGKVPPTPHAVHKFAFDQ